MRCMRHYYDISSFVGICASCLRERLSTLTEAEEQMNLETLPEHQKQQSNPQPHLLLPQSISQYTIKHHLDEASTKHQWRLFSTPQIEITSDTNTTTRKHTAAANKFSAITKLFKSKSEKFNNESLKTDKHENLAAPTSPSWFASLRRKSKFTKSTPGQTPHTNQCIGVSPIRASREAPSGKPVKKKSMSSASSRRVKSTTDFTGMIFGLSPLIQPSPIRLRSHNSYTSEAFSCELRVPAKAAMSTSSSLRGSRSRKIVESPSLIFTN